MDSAMQRMIFIATRSQEIEMMLSMPDIVQEQDRYQKLIKEHLELAPVVAAYEAYAQAQNNLAQAQALLEDASMQEMAQEEIRHITAHMGELEVELQRLLLPKDRNDERSVILEIRAGTGGEEAALFGSDLLRMYARYAESKGWKLEIISLSETEIGGMKEAVALIAGVGAYSRLKFESGVHRVQRIPKTESGGRIHTSAATVAVMPEAEDVEVTIDPGDLRIDVYRAGGKGGQNVNKVESAVRITHLPSGLVVACQDERSQLHNKERAMRVLKSRLLEMQTRMQEEKLSSMRKGLVGSGDRSERIRTYNFPQNRITDHRINLTLHQLSSFIQGDMDELLTALILQEQSDRLEALQNE